MPNYTKWADCIPFPSNSETRSFKKKVEWTQHQRLEDKTVKGNLFRQHKYCLERERKENTPAQSARVQTVRDSDGTSIQCINSILEYYVTLGIPQTWQKSNY